MFHIGSALGAIFDLFAADLMGQFVRLHLQGTALRLVPEGLQLDRSFTAKNPG